MSIESNTGIDEELVERSSPELSLIVFALSKLIEESQKQESNVWGVVKRKRLSRAIKDVSQGKEDKATRLLRVAAKRYDDLKTLSYNLSSLATHLPPPRAGDPLQLKSLFFESVATLFELKKVREKAAKPGSSDLDLQQKLGIERQAEALLTGNLSGPKRPGQEERLLEQALELKGKIWPEQN